MQDSGYRNCTGPLRSHGPDQVELIWLFPCVWAQLLGKEKSCDICWLYIYDGNCIGTGAHIQLFPVVSPISPQMPVGVPFGFIVGWVDVLYKYSKWSENRMRDIEYGARMKLVWAERESVSTKLAALESVPLPERVYIIYCLFVCIGTTPWRSVDVRFRKSKLYESAAVPRAWSSWTDLIIHLRMGTTPWRRRELCHMLAIYIWWELYWYRSNKSIIASNAIRGSIRIYRWFGRCFVQ